MILERLELRNYQGFAAKPDPISLERDLTVLVGPNDTGKSNILRGLALYRNPDKVGPQSFRSKQTGSSEPPSVVTTWRVPEKGDWKQAWKEITGTAGRIGRLTVKCTSGQMKWWCSNIAEEDQKNVSARKLGKISPKPLFVDFASGHDLPSVPSSLETIQEIDTPKGEIVRQLVEWSKGSIDTLLGADYDHRRRILREVCTAFNKKLAEVIPDVPELELRLTDEDGPLDIDFTDGYSSFLPNQRGYGLLKLLSAVVQILLIAKGTDGGNRNLILLDEPETALHPGAQMLFQRFLRGIAERKGNQIIYATHSPFMIDPNRIRQVRLVGKDGTTCFVENKPWRRLHEEPIRSALQLPLGYGLFLAERNVFVEGMCDQVLLVALSQACAAYGMAHLDLRRTSIAPAGGAGQSLFGCLAARASRPDARVAAVYDKDEAGCQALKRAREAGYECTLFVDGTRFNGEELGSPEFTVEDLVPSRVYLQAFKTNYETVDGGGWLSPDAIPSDEMVRLLEQEQEIGRPILEACQQFTCRNLKGSGYGFRKHDVAQEAAFVLLEGMPVGPREPDSLYSEADLEPAAKLFENINQFFEQAAHSG